ncbi:hypothetical protein B0T25DRAFT_191048 [Lasiosphaeria hispida]|uniref:CCHC-type domain-containing protein n=1 Tax=Lasiosphaeria hispida TaxID=260671 RepID=A0AAJ0HHV3_9PEZI|nr:hypothetical protein B0T25DRAFT_191048 [Lasiosphaeria hispida]
MASAAPGQSAAQTEPICYNCGTRGHWVVACPEPTRDKPAGFQRWQSQVQENSQSLERSGPSGDKKGPIVTRYPPPPGQPPAISRYGPPPAPPPQFASGPPPPISPQGYSQPGYPPPPSFGVGYPPPPPPQYGQYPPAAAPPPPQYGQHPPYGQPQYPPAFPPAGYYPNNIPPPPPSFSPGAYPPPPPQYGGLPPPPPPAANPYHPHYPAAAPPPSEYQYLPGQPLSFGPPPPNSNPFPPAPAFDRPYGLPPRPPPPANQVGQNNHRGKQKKHQESKRSDSRKDKHRHGHDNIPKGGPNRNGRDGTPKGGSNRSEKQAERRPVLPEQPPKEKRPQTPPVSEPKEGEDEGDGEGDGDGEWDPESAQDLGQVFAKTKAKLADPVGIPLPYEYSDEPTIPPAYNATCVKSAFFNKENEQEFAMSIRETAHWFTLKDDPVFKRYSGMVMRNFPDYEHDYPAYNPPSPPPSSDQIKMPPLYRVTVRKATPERKARDEIPGGGPASNVQSFTPENRHRDSPSSRYDRDERGGSDSRGDRLFAKRSRDQSPDTVGHGSRDVKRSKNSESQRDTPRDGRSKPLSPSRGASPSPRFNLDRDPWSPQAGESTIKVLNDHRYLDVQNDSKSSSSREERAPYTSSMRHDSGYHSGQSQDRVKASSHRDDHSHRPLNRPLQKRRSPSRSRSCGGSSDERSERSRSESPLTALEAGLLGLTDETEEAEKESAARERKLKMAKKPIRRVKVAAAFSRRW